MKKSNINYPHPVLNVANEDYINSSFNISLPSEAKVEGDQAFIEVEYELVSPGLEKMVEEGTAHVVVYIESVHSEYRKSFLFQKESHVLTIVINKNDINKNVRVKGYIIAATPLDNFSLPEHNKALFGTIPFTHIRRGDILAIANDYYDIPLENYDPLADRPSIFSIRRQTESKDEIQVDFFSSHKITIFLNNEIFDNYQKLYEAPELRGILATVFAVPVLVDVLSYIKNASQEDLDNISDKKWYQVIMARIADLHINLPTEASMTKVANQVLPHVFKSFIDALQDVFKSMLPTGGEGK